MNLGDKLFLAIKNTTQILSELGFKVHPDKSVLEPQLKSSVLGFILNDPSDMKIRLPEEKVQDISDIVRNLFFHITSTSIRQVAQVIGKLVSIFPAVQF